jgi:hypothetical protein
VTRYKSLDQAPPGLRKLYEEQYGRASGQRPARAGGNCRSEPPKRQKYGNIRTEFKGETFDSKAEAEDEQILAMREAAGEIGGYARQVTIPLRAGARKRGSRAKFDWLVNEPRPHRCSNCGHEDRIMGLVLKDTKGMITQAWETKRRLVEAQLGVKIEVIQH